MNITKLRNIIMVALLINSTFSHAQNSAQDIPSDAVVIENLKTQIGVHLIKVGWNAGTSFLCALVAGGSLVFATPKENTPPGFNLKENAPAIILAVASGIIAVERFLDACNHVTEAKNKSITLGALTRKCTACATDKLKSQA